MAPCLHRWHLCRPSLAVHKKLHYGAANLQLPSRAPRTAAHCKKSIQPYSLTADPVSVAARQPKNDIGRVSDDDRDGLHLRQQPHNVFEKNDIILLHPNHGVLLGQHGLINPPHFDCREQHRRCRKQVCPVSLDEVSRGRTKSDDQIGRSLSVERAEIFGEFGLSRVIATPSRD
jgi:hypothetical protein